MKKNDILQGTLALIVLKTIAAQGRMHGYAITSHIQHVSARETVETIERAKAAGTQVTCEASPHHLLLTHEDVRSLDTNFKMNPPLRAEEDRLALVDALRSGAIDCVATDHAPHAREEKEHPFEQAPMGVTGLETAFAALHTGLVLPGTPGGPASVRPTLG